MSFSIKKLLFSFVCSVALWSCVMADKKVTVGDVQVDIPSNDVIDSWTADLANDIFNSEITVKQNCPSSLQLEINIYQGDDLVNNVKQSLDRPVDNMKKYNLCPTMDYPEPDDSSCSMADGEYSMKDCDVRSYFNDMEAGTYTVVGSFTQGTTEITTITMNVQVDDE